ncbi:hypothetical protein G6F46_011277 [Rhizopus delemar]|uniref:Uncharacterized protein n=2 Tax=Rhizopus TaxID=4842 RepID=A0A9P6Y6W8_RHIOR|nr:hypothetical protein G6F52_004413 [Rhizopus delemar]KAG1540507.1 hypothetical protein G6F51_008482 [Rhizopus arrhizus]KAG1584537.1 hypothetical protein G6F48_007831 [Rhizopus delemar]KAG1608807.1 hypothetical protein G6F46_011277 [Rhizopus delemar]KAG1639625.1 hypothetical protein G6F44_007645 [Rhizopus delemar]
MKNEEYQMVRYVRKPPGEKSVAGRIRILQQTVSRLKERSMVDKFFISVCCNSNDPIVEGDMKLEGKDIQKLITKTDGTMQGKVALDDICSFVNIDGQILIELISYLTNTKKVCLVVIDYAGLSTNVDNLRNFIWY